MPTYSVEKIQHLIPKDVAAGCTGDYSFTEADMRVALALFQRYVPRNVLDFGVNWGSTADFLLHRCPWIDHWVGVDLEPDLFPERGIVPKQAGHLAAHDSRFDLILTDETVVDFQRDFSELILDWERREDVFDCIIVDANHTEAGTRRDTEACERFAAKNCLWLWHDYNVDSRQAPMGRPFGVKAYLDSLIAQGRPINVPDETDRDPWQCCSLAWEIR